MKVLLLDAAFAAEPIYNALLSLGHDVWVMGNRPQDVLAIRAAERWVHQDYSKVDAVREHALRLGVDAVLPGCTDVSLETCLKLDLNFPYGDSDAINAVLSDKSAFRRLCMDLNLPAPRTVSEVDFPKRGLFICKPVDAFSGRGITVFDGLDIEAMRRSASEARAVSRSGGIVIEDYCNGDLYSCSLFVENSQLTDIFYVREGSSANPYAVDTSYVVHDLPRECSLVLESGLNKLCLSLGLKDGLLHTQFIMSDGKPFIVEVTRRCPGDLYSLLIEYSTGFQYAKKYAASFLRESINLKLGQRRHILRHTVTSLDHSVYQGIRFKNAVGVKAFFPLMSVGGVMQPRQGNRGGVLFVESDSCKQLGQLFEEFMSRDVYDVAWQ